MRRKPRNPENPVAFSRSTDVQTLLFPKDRFTAATARAWAERHDFRAAKVDAGSATATRLRVRQRDPGAFQKGSFRTITLDRAHGVEAVIGKPATRKNPSKSAAQASDLWLVIRQDRAPGSDHWMSRSGDWVVRGSLEDAKKKAIIEADEYADAQTGGWKYRTQVFPAAAGKYGVEAITDKPKATVLPSKTRSAETDRQRRMERALRGGDYQTYNKLQGRKK